MSIIPTAFQFHFTFPVQRIDALPRPKPPLLKLPEACVIPFPSTLEGGPNFAEMRIAWNRDGLGCSLSVTGKGGDPSGDPESLESSDMLMLWLDIRHTQNVHRATRFCHLFCLCPMGGGEKGADPFVKQLPIPRAKDDAPEIDPDSVLLEAQLEKTGYRLDAWFPADTLNGFDPRSQSTLGFYAVVQDQELGRQHLTIGDEFPFSGDPSLWSSLELVT